MTPPPRPTTPNPTTPRPTTPNPTTPRPAIAQTLGAGAGRALACARAALVRFFNSRRATINALAGYVALALCASLRTGHFEKAVFVSALAASLFAFMQKPQAKA